jgi:ABC-type transporter Mla maintaining outer membrane lipid asymmetry ATPase subunit MlaF
MSAVTHSAAIPIPDAAPLITVRNLSFRRGSRIIFQNVDLAIPRGKITAIMGPSGTGKTTLLRLIGGQIRPDAGRIDVDGPASTNWGAASCTSCVSAWACCFKAAHCSPI